jgi:hypothetical protein
MNTTEPWDSMASAIEFASRTILDDREPLNEQELVDGQRYVARIIRAVTEASLIDLDFERPSFLPMMEPVRHLGAAGPDIDYDIAVLVAGRGYRISGQRGDATYVGIVVYGGGGAMGDSTILSSVDVDELVDADGRFTYEIDHPDAARAIVRQYFHDRSEQRSGQWAIERTDADASELSAPAPQHPGIVGHQITNASSTLRWNAELNRLWTPDRRDHPHTFVHQTADEIAAAVPNPDVHYSFTWWRLAAGEALVIDVTPPETRYWCIQLCDRWFQSYPQRQSNLNDAQLEHRPDGTVQIVLADRDPGGVNWIDTGGHTTGVVFFRWLHAEPHTQPSCTVVPTDTLS